MHDASKQGSFKRKLHTNLAIDDFRNALAAFCTLSYAKEKTSFTRGELRELLGKAFELERRAINADDFIKDLLECVCVLQVEGLDIEFTHRSFQEYFVHILFPGVRRSR
jgi:hypothetical protein